MKKQTLPWNRLYFTPKSPSSTKSRRIFDQAGAAIQYYFRTKRTKAGSDSSNCFKFLFGLLSFTYSAQKQTDQELYLQSLSRTSAPPPTPPALRIALTLEWPSSDWHGHRPGPRRLNQQGIVSTSSISCGDLSFL